MNELPDQQTPLLRILAEIDALDVDAEGASDDRATLKVLRTTSAARPTVESLARWGSL